MVCCQSEEASVRLYIMHSGRLQAAAVARIQEVLQSCQKERRGGGASVTPEVKATLCEVTWTLVIRIAPKRVFRGCVLRMHMNTYMRTCVYAYAYTYAYERIRYTPGTTLLVMLAGDGL
jgi:hypothetical protein